MAVRDILQPVSLAAETNTDYSAFMREVFINETPALTRFPMVKKESKTFSVFNYEPRARTGLTITEALADTTGTAVTISDSSTLLVGDIILIGTERLEVVAIVSGTVLTVERGAEGSTAATAADNATVTLLYNSRTGAEVDQVAQRAARTSYVQYMQTFQHPVQVGGLVNAMRAIELPPGFTNVFSAEQEAKMVEFVRDVEYALYFGNGQAATVLNDRQVMKGFKKLIGDAGNAVTSPTNASAYTPLDFLRDGVEAALTDGGNPDVCICGLGFLTGIAKWGHAAQQLEAGGNAFGTPIRVLEVPFLGHPLLFIPSLQLASKTAIVLTSSEVKIAEIRPMFWNQRGNRGDATEGEWIGDYSLQLENPQHHAWIEGITAYAA